MLIQLYFTPNTKVFTEVRETLTIESFWPSKDVAVYEIFAAVASAFAERPTRRFLGTDLKDEFRCLRKSMRQAFQVNNHAAMHL